MWEDYYRDRGNSQNTVADDKYYYSYRHRLRAEYLNDIAEEIRVEIEKVREFLRELDTKKCSPDPVPRTMAGDSPAVKGVLDTPALCIQGLNKISPNGGLMTFDDFRYLIKLPVPVNVIPTEVIKQIEDPSMPIDERKAMYAQYVFRHWVERLDQIRCRLFLECMARDDKEHYYEMILESLSNSQTGVFSILGATGSISRGVHVPGGYIIDIADAHTDSRVTAYDLYSRVPGKDWVNIYGSRVVTGGHAYRFTVPPQGIDIGIAAYECPPCNVAIDGVVIVNNQFSVQLRYFDSGEVQASHHNIEINISAVLDPKFP
jgi:hypothetical protein